jgi:hypothetical protein
MDDFNNQSMSTARRRAQSKIRQALESWEEERRKRDTRSAKVRPAKEAAKKST